MEQERHTHGSWNPFAMIAARVRGQPDTEFEQATIRIVIATMATLYFVFSHVLGHLSLESPSLVAALGVYYFACGAIWTAIIVHPKVSTLRRVIGLLADLSITLYCMYELENWGVPLFAILLWVTFGNGFRFGTGYLYLSMFLSVVGFSIVRLESDYWQDQGPLFWGILISLILLPGYVSQLIKRLNEAIDRAQSANAAKTSFLANMSHELRTPLNGVIGMTDLLIGTRLGKEQRDYAETIHASANALLALVNDILDISKIEVGKLTFEPTECELPMLVQSTVKMLKPQATEKGLYMRVDIASDVPVVVRADPQYLRQVLINLVGNAIKFTEEGGIEVRVIRLADRDDTVKVRFEVIDTGIGIPTDVQDRIFDTFSQADDSATRRYGGTGLGTAISKQLIELMGGQIGLQSSPGQGSRFWFSLDFERPSVEQGMSAGGLADCRLMLLADAAREPGDLSAWLPQWLRTVETAHGENQALQILKGGVLDQEPLNGLILDTRAVHLSPTRLAEQIKGDAALADVELFAVTERSEDVKILEAAGYTHVFKAPLDKTVVFNALHHALVKPVPGDADVTRLMDYYTQPGESRSLRILMAEDNPVNQKVTSKILERAGHEVRVVENGQQVLEQLEAEGRFDVVICDMHMPVMGGIEAMKMHRFAQPNHPVPFIMLTANATTEARNECEEAGAEGFLTKPIRAHALYEALGRTTDARHSGAVEIAGTGSETASLTKLAELKALSPDTKFVRELVGIFMDDANKLLEQMEAAGMRGDIQEMKSLAHSFKGSAASIGAQRLCDVTAELNQLSINDPAERGLEQLKRLRRELDEVEAELMAFLDEPDMGVSH